MKNRLSSAACHPLILDSVRIWFEMKRLKCMPVVRSFAVLKQANGSSNGPKCLFIDYLRFSKSR